MEITTLITWNGLVYLLYYGLNMGYDYLNYRRNQAKSTETYSYKSLLKEAPVKVDIPTNTGQQKTASTAAKELRKKPKKSILKSPVTIDGPVEDQGFPMKEFLKTSKSFSHNINF